MATLSKKLSERMHKALAEKKRISDEGSNEEDVSSKKRKASSPEEVHGESDEEKSYKKDGELITFESGIGKELQMYLTKEVQEELRSLEEQARSGKSVTVPQLKVFTTTALQLLLRYNDRPSYQLTKNELAVMVADYMKNGCPPRCPKCNVGHLKFSNGKKKSGKRYYWCPGSTKDGRHFLGCNFRASRDEIQRSPWKYP